MLALFQFSGTSPTSHAFTNIIAKGSEIYNANSFSWDEIHQALLTAA